MKHTMGTVEVITGSMFCGKTDELIRRLRRATIARQKVQVFKPTIDHRYALEKVTSHAGSEYAARPIPHARALLDQLEPATTVVLSSPEGLTAVHWETGPVPADVWFQPIPPEATDEERAQARADIRKNGHPQKAK